METTSDVSTDTPQPEPVVPAGVQAAWAVAGLPGGFRATSYLMGELAAAKAALYHEVPLAPHPLWLDEVCDELDAVNQSMVMSMLHSFNLNMLVVESGHLVNVVAVPLAAVYQVIRTPGPLSGASLTLALWSRNFLEYLTYSFMPSSLGGPGGSVGSVEAGVHRVSAPAEIQGKMGWRLYTFQPRGHFSLDFCHQPGSKDAMASEVRGYLLVWTRTRTSVCTDHEAGIEILGSVLGVLADQNAKTTIDTSRMIPDSGNREHGRKWRGRGEPGCGLRRGIRIGLGLESALGGDDSGDGFGGGDPEPMWLDTGRRSRNTVPSSPRIDVVDFAVTAWRRMPGEQCDREKEFIVLLLPNLEKLLDF